MKTAILVDGGFYRKMAKRHFGEKSPVERAQELFSYCRRHLKQVDHYTKDEGIDFILDPMGHPINDTLQEHIDGLRSYYSITMNAPADSKA